MDEVIWKDIPGYEDMYAINQFGQVKSYGRDIDCGHGVRRTKDRILRAAKCSRNGHRQVRLYIGDRKNRLYYVHRLIAAAFLGIDLDDPKVMVFHRKGLEDTVDNLVVCTNYDKISDARRQLATKTASRPVVCVDPNHTIMVFDSRKLASKYLGCSYETIRDCLRAKRPFREHQLFAVTKQDIEHFINKLTRQTEQQVRIA